MSAYKFQPSVFLQDRIQGINKSRVSSIKTKKSRSKSLVMSADDAVIDQDYKIISDVDTQKVKQDYVDGVFQTSTAVATGGPNPNKDDDDEEEQPVLEDLLNDNNLIMKTFSKAQKVV